MTQQMPCNVEAERSLIASFLNDYVVKDVFDLINHHDLYQPKNKAIFSAIEALCKLNQTVDVASVSGGLHSAGKYEIAGGVQELVSIMEDVPVAINPMQHARTIKAMSVARDLIKAANKIQMAAMTASTDTIDDIIDSAQSEIFGVKTNNSDNACVPFSKLISSRVDDYEAMSVGKPVGIKTGYKFFDYMTGGFWGSKLVILAARPGIGKTAFMLNMARNMAKSGHKIGVFELEMDTNELIDRLVSSASDISSIKLASGNIENGEWDKILDAAERISPYQIFVDDTGGLTIGDIKRRSRAMFKSGVEIIFIDQLSKIRGGVGKSEYEQRSYIVNELMVLKKELRIPIVLLAQINRNADQRSASKPAISDLKSTGSLEEDADIVIIGHRPYPYTKKPEDKDKASWEIAKHRGGPTGSIEMMWNARTTTFYEMEC